MTKHHTGGLCVPLSSAPTLLRMRLSHHFSTLHNQAAVPQRAVDLFFQNDMAFSHFNPSSVEIRTGVYVWTPPSFYSSCST